MLSLHEAQSRVLDALLAGPEDAALVATLDWIDAPPEEAAARLEVYRNTVRHNFIESLASTFPVIARLVGAAYFRQLARSYLAAHPSRSGDRAGIGREFADFLTTRHGADEYAYLPDVARFEWLIEESLRSATRARLDLAKLAALAPEEYDALAFDLHPSLRLYVSRYPVHLIWRANKAEAEPERIDLDSGGTMLGLMRRGSELVFIPLAAGEHRFLVSLEEGAELACAIRAAQAAEAEFDAGGALRRFVAADVIVDCRLSSIGHRS